MTKPVPPSRLNLKYRTQIDGKEVEEALPFRLLVLGNFSNGNPSKLESREVHSVHLGTKLDSFMDELEVTAPIEDPELATLLHGSLTGRLRGEVKRELPDGRAIVKLVGEGQVAGARSDNGLGNFSGGVQLIGEVEAELNQDDLTLPAPRLRILGKVTGDLTGDVCAEVECQLDRTVVPADEIDVQVIADVPVKLTIPIRSLSSFSPEHIARCVPEIRRLFVLGQLLVDLRSKISDHSALRDQLKKTLRHPELATLREWLGTRYQELQVERMRGPQQPALPPAPVEIQASASGPALSAVIDVTPAGSPADASTPGKED